MLASSRIRTLLLCTGCFCIGWLIAEPGRVAPREEPPPVTKSDAPAFPMSARLAANIYLQRTAEYRACCLGIYKSASLRLPALLKSVSTKAARPAVVMDLDETVFDNSSLETFFYKNKLEYTDALWDDYEENYPQDVRLIPGAKEFIEQAEDLGVTVVYISNRSEPFRKSTVSAFQRLGINTSNIDGRLYLKAKDGKSDKSSRRDAAMAKFNVLMYFGDNLRDFSEVFVADKLPKDAEPEKVLEAIGHRQALTDEAKCHWGIDWFVLPNPVYGEWEKLVGLDPIAILETTSMTVKQTGQSEK